MDSNLKPYEEYKETEYDWLGSVPRHWKEQTVRSITKLSSERNGNRDDLELLSVYREYGVIRKSSRDDNHNVESQDLSNYKFVDSGYLVLNKMKMWQGSLGVSRHRGIVSPAYIVCKLIGDLNHEYIHYLMRSAKFKTIYNRISYGVRVGQWDMRYDDFKNIKIFLPPIAEQNQIVKYLDYQLAKINKFIQAKKKLIAVLKEQKQAIVNDAVTKGIAQNVKMKPSGIELLEEIPEHWEKVLCKRLLTTLTDYTANGSFGDLAKNVSYLDSGYARIVRLTDLRTNLSNKGVYVSEHAYNYLRKSALFGGEFLIANVGAYSGYACIMPNVEYPATLAPNMMMAKFRQERVVTNFIVELFNSLYVQTQLKIKANNTAAQPKINKDDFKQVILAIPSIEEQEQILDYISEKTMMLDNSILTTEKEIELINEYRIRLVSDVVTGKIDIRHIEIDIQENGLNVEDIEEDTVELEEVLEGEECEV